MIETEKSEDSLTKSVHVELDQLLQCIETKLRLNNALKKYVVQIQKAIQNSDERTLSKLLSGEIKSNLVTSYPTSNDIIDKLMIIIRRSSDASSLSLVSQFQDYSEKKGIPLRGKFPKFSLDNLLEIEIHEAKRTAKIGTIFLKTLDKEKIFNAVDAERQRIWNRPFNPEKFRGELVDLYKEIILIKPNPVGWVRLEDIYQGLKNRVKANNPTWKTGGRLVAYYKDEFSADLSKLWRAQTSTRLIPPHVEISGIRDPRFAYKVVMPGGQVVLYGHMRPVKEGI